jgi:teichuronic acid biosynthesis glycosyltransferase TuaC
MRILSLSCAFPNPAEPELGVFVRARLQAISTMGVELQVIAPVPIIDYSRIVHGSRTRETIPSTRQDQSIRVFHPRWSYLPYGACVNAVLLFLQLVVLTKGIRKQHHFDWIDAHFGFPDGIAAALLARYFLVPFSITLRGNETMHVGRSRCIRVLMRWALVRATRVITVSGALRQFAIALGASPDATRIIPNGIDFRIFYPRDRAKCRRDLGVPAGVSLVVSVGSLIERKGHHRVIEAISKLLDKSLAVCLFVVGGPGREGDFAHVLENAPARLGITKAVRFLGHIGQERLAEVMSAADLFCLASSREGCPNVVLEALACGTPVVATDVGAVAELIPSREYGLVVPPDDNRQLEDAIQSALLTKWNRESVAQWGSSRSWGHVAAEVLACFHEVDSREDSSASVRK